MADINYAKELFIKGLGYLESADFFAAPEARPPQYYLGFNA